jgi:hypothetical protein
LTGIVSLRKKILSDQALYAKNPQWTPGGMPLRDLLKLLIIELRSTWTLLCGPVWAIIVMAEPVVTQMVQENTPLLFVSFPESFNSTDKCVKIWRDEIMSNKTVEEQPAVGMNRISYAFTCLAVLVLFKQIRHVEVRIPTVLPSCQIFDEGPVGVSRDWQFPGVQRTSV